MWKFTKLLFTNWVSVVSYLLSILAIVGLFVGPVGIPPWTPLVFLLFGLYWASYKIYEQQRREIESLQKAKLEKKAALVIHQYPRSRFIRYAAREDRTKSLGTFIELDLGVENKGERNSNINRFDLAVTELGKEYPDIKPQYKTSIQGERTAYGVGQSWLIKGSPILTVEGQKVSTGKLLFHVSDRIPASYSAIHCWLTLWDTDGNKVLSQFELPESR